MIIGMIGDNFIQCNHYYFLIICYIMMMNITMMMIILINLIIMGGQMMISLKCLINLAINFIIVNYFDVYNDQTIDYYVSIYQQIVIIIIDYY